MIKQKDIKCEMCSGHGMIGGFQGGAAPGYVSEECPDCSGSGLKEPTMTQMNEQDVDVRELPSKTVAQTFKKVRALLHSVSGSALLNGEKKSISDAGLLYEYVCLANNLILDLESHYEESLQSPVVQEHASLSSNPSLLDRAYIASSAVQVPDGWKLVPIEPTKEMEAAAKSSSGPFSAYTMMVSAAPQPVSQDQFVDANKLVSDQCEQVLDMVATSVSVGQAGGELTFDDSDFDNDSDLWRYINYWTESKPGLDSETRADRVDDHIKSLIRKYLKAQHHSAPVGEAVYLYREAGEDDAWMVCPNALVQVYKNQGNKWEFKGPLFTHPSPADGELVNASKELAEAGLAIAGAYVMPSLGAASNRVLKALASREGK